MNIIQQPFISHFNFSAMLLLQILWLMVVFMGHTTRGALFCDKDLVEQAWKVCNTAYQPNDIDGDVDVKEMCKNIDCHLQCYLDAVGECENSGEFVDKILEYDPRKWKIYYRAACSDETLAAKLISNRNSCQHHQSCPDEDFASDSSLLDLYKAGRYEDYKRLLCSNFAKGRACVNVSQTENCSAASAMYYEDIVKIGSSVSFCENTDIKHLYTLYGGDVKCVNPKVNSRCFPSKVRSDILKCSDQLVSVQSAAMSQSEFNMSRICERMECDIKCFEAAVGQCYMEDENVLLDPIAIKVSTRAACDKKDVFEAAINECDLGIGPCILEFSSALIKADNFSKQQNYEEYKKTVCSASSTLRKCLKIVASGKCTAEMASLLQDIMEVSYSFAGCGQQNHAFFSKYSYKEKCDVSAGGILKANPLLTFVLSFSSCFFLFVSKRHFLC